MSHLSLSFFGVFQTELDGHPIQHFRSTNVQALLVYLALQAERPFSRDVLATLFWPDEPEKIARANLRQSIYQLRKTLNDTGQKERPFFLVTRQNIQFNPDCDYQLDVQQFLQALEMNDLETAVSHVQGTLLPGFICDSLEFEDWLRLKREQLHKMTLDALSRHTDVLIANSDYAKAATFAQQQIELEPWHEAGHRQLMQTLALHDKRNQALRQFEQCKTVLQEELGIEPDEQTVALYEQILSNELIPAKTSLPIQQTSFVKHNLTPKLTPFFDREEEQKTLRDHIANPQFRLITLLGEGGIGKSRLSQELGWQLREQFPDGIWFVSLANLTAVSDTSKQQEAIATFIAQTIHCPLSGNRPPQTQIIDFLRQRRTLLILDNFEHILAGADLIAHLLQETSEVTILATSREPLNFMGEMTYQINRLPVPALPNPLQQDEMPRLESYPSVQLFIDRAQRANGRFTLTTENEADVAIICQIVAGSPLGLELAAASLRRQSLPNAIVAIRSSLDHLATTQRDVPARHRSMRAVFTSSWELLDDFEQTAFAKLSIFQGGFNAHAARTITNADLFQLHTFVDKSLLQADGERFVIHELLRQYAAEKRNELLDTPGLRKAHSDYYLNYVAAQKEIIVGATPRIALDKITADLDNIRQGWQTAVSHHQTDTIINSANTLADYYQIRGLYREGEQLFATAANQLASVASPAEKARLLTHQAGMFVRMSAYQSAIASIEQALALLNDDKSNWVFSRLHITWGEALWRQGELTQAEEHLTLALKTAQTLNKPALQAYARFHLGIVHDYRGELEQALTYFEDALQLWRQLNNRRQQGFTLNSIGTVAGKLKNTTKAITALNESFQISQENNDLQAQIMTQNNLSLLATNENRFEEANQHLVKALELANFTGDEHALAMLNYNLGWNSYQFKDLEMAKQFAEYSLKLREKIGDLRGKGKTMLLLGNIEKENENTSIALEYYQIGLKLSKQVADQQTESEILDAINHIELTQKRGRN